jgi:hypothetical protein
MADLSEIDPLRRKDAHFAKNCLGHPASIRAKNARWRVPAWEEFGYTPTVLVSVANKELAAYGTWKCAQAIGAKGNRQKLEA